MSRRSSGMIVVVSLVFAWVFVPLGFQGGTSGHAALAAARISRLAGSLPLAFEPNEGQVTARADFVAHSGRATVLLSAAGISIVSSMRHGRAATTRIAWLGARPHAAALPGDRLPGTVSYLGTTYRRSAIPTYGLVRYHNVYPGIDLRVHGTAGRLEYDWLVRPGADPRRIAFRLTGGPVRPARDGSIAVGHGASAFRQERPRVYQQIGGQRHQIAARYERIGGGTFGIILGRYDRHRPLIIDPSVLFSTLLNLAPVGVGVDDSGNIYLAGAAYLDAYAGGTLLDAAGGNAPVVLKLDPTGQQVLATTYIGNSEMSVTGMAVSHDGTVHLTGIVWGRQLPVVAAAQPTFDGQQDCFVLALDRTGTRLLYSTYLGGSGYDTAAAIAVDPTGAVVVAGETSSKDFPLVHALQRHNHAGQMANGTTAFVARLDPSGQIVYSTYLGGSGGDAALAAATDAAGDAYVGGWTSSVDFPVVNALQPTSAWFAAGFLAKISPTGDHLLYSTRFGDYGDRINAVALDANDDVYVAGDVSNPKNYPTVNALQPQFGGVSDGFAAEIDSTGRHLLYSTFLGGSGSDEANAIAVDAAGDAYVAGDTGSPDFPVVAAVQPRIGGSVICNSATDCSHPTQCSSPCASAFVLRLAPGGGSLRYSTFLGGSGSDSAASLALTTTGVVVTGGYPSSNFPVVRPLQSALDPNQMGGYVAEIADAPDAAVPLATRAPVPTATPAPVPCPAGLLPSSLGVVRYPSFPADFLKNTGPLRASADADTAVLALYKTICALPLAPPRINCPIDYGSEYSLTFLRASTILLSIDADASGCRSLLVREPGFPPAAYSTSDAFWSELATALKLPEKSLFPATTSIGDVTGETFIHQIGIALGLDLTAPVHDALVRGIVLVQNESNSSITLVPSCVHGNPWAEVRDRDGRLLDPPAVPPLGTTACANAPIVVAAHQYIDRPLYLVLRGDRLQALATIQINGQQLALRSAVYKLPPPSTFTTKPIPPARAMLRTQPAVSIDLVKPAKSSGAPLYTESFLCPGGSAGWRDWMHAAGSHLMPPCAHPLVWHVVAGWLNHPVASVNYVRHTVVRPVVGAR